jgi:hypothetical protein
MKKAVFIFVSFLLIVIVIFNIDFPLSENNLSGKYINTNFNNPICCVEAPHVSDTLTLKDDGTFTSKFYGNGEFNIQNGLNPEIEWTYVEFGKKAIYKTSFSNKIFKKQRIILNADLNHYYEKIE